MLLFNSRSILKKEEAEQVALNYNPRQFLQSKPASEFVAQLNSSDEGFKLNPLIADHAGVSSHERDIARAAIEAETLNQLKSIEETAYQKAYDLGLEEGRKRAFEENNHELQMQMQNFENLLKTIETLKADLVQFNEHHIIKMICYLAERVAMAHIRQNEDVILDVLKSLLDSTLNSEQITIYLSKKDYDFLQKVRQNLGKDFEALKKTRLEIGNEVEDGGCIIETNYGLIDASLLERVKRMTEALDALAPQVKDKLGDGSSK